ncbi:MAG TPA: hypothetical protein VN541_07360 [Tepidisphaeraceae bacterium]|nr:hypothetical protein [Tepidisphaeraceae bacterium]
MLRKQINDALIRLARAQTAFLDTQFLAPVVRGRGVGVSIAGVQCNLLVVPPEFQGWGVFRPLSHSVAVRVREASSAERRKYLELFPQVRLIVCERAGNRALALAADLSDERFAISNPVPLHLAQDAELFDTVAAGFDGVRFWFDQPDPRTDPDAAAYLRRSLSKMTEPDKLDWIGLTEGDRRAYSIAYAKRAVAMIATEHPHAEPRLNGARAPAEPSLRRFGAQTAGICLLGEDCRFDLSSFVGVIPEHATGLLLCHNLQPRFRRR